MSKHAAAHICKKACKQDVSILCFKFSQTRNDHLTHDTEAVLSFRAWGANHRRGATSEARSEPTGRATHLLLRQDTLCCTPPERERSAASRLWLLLCPS